MDVFGWAAQFYIAPMTRFVNLPLRDGRAVRGRLDGATSTHVLLGNAPIPVAALKIDLKEST